MEHRSRDLAAAEIQDRVGYLSFTDTERLNVFSIELADQCLSILDQFRENDDVRTIVIRGTGKIFSAGGDVKQMLRDVTEGDDRAAYFRQPLSTFNRLALRVMEVPKPVLAAVHGAVAGVAFNLMLACDLALAAEGTRFTQAFVRLGLSPDGGGTFFLPQIVGRARACELTMLPTEIDAATALRWGLVNRIVPAASFDQEVAAFAGRLAEGPAAALARTKALLTREAHRDLAEVLEAERHAQIENAASRNFQEGLTAFVEKRQPVFDP